MNRASQKTFSIMCALLRVGDFLALINRINKLEKPDFVIITGDLTQNGQDEETRNFKACLLRFEVPVFTTPGNHDDISDSGDPFTDYREYINPPVLSDGEDTVYCDDYSFDYGDFHFISYNSGDAYGSSTKLEGLTLTQLNWMKADAANSTKPHTFIFTHAPSVPDGPRTAIPGDGLDDHSHESNDHPDYDVSFVSWLNGGDASFPQGQYVEVVFAGHTHMDHIWHTVTTNNIKSPLQYSNPTQSRTLTFGIASAPYYIETDTACEEYPDEPGA